MRLLQTLDRGSVLQGLLVVVMSLKRKCCNLVQADCCKVSQKSNLNLYLNYHSDSSLN